MINYAMIGTRIKKARKEKKISQEKLAEALDVSVTYCSKIETGKAKVNLERLSQISAILNKSLEYFVTGVVHDDNAYLNEELTELLKKCSGKKRDAILKVLDIMANL